MDSKRGFILIFLPGIFLINCMSSKIPSVKPGCESTVSIIKEIGSRIVMVDHDIYNYVYKENEIILDSMAKVRERTEFLYLIDKLLNEESECITNKNLEYYWGIATHSNEFENGINYFYRFNTEHQKNCFEANVFSGDVLDYEDCALIRFTFDKKGNLIEKFNSFY